MLLSIDLDFFCREKVEWDWGHNEQPIYMGTTIWMIRYVSFDLYTETDIETYADCHPAKFIYALEQKGFKITPNTLVGVGWSHKEAYDFFKGCKSKTIYNFDAHHDCGYGPKKELDYGN